MPDLIAIANNLTTLAALLRDTPAPAPEPDMPLSLADMAVSLVKPFIEAKEGMSLTAYLDSSDTWTIGYGHTAGVRPGMRITQAQADAFLAMDLLTFSNGVLPLVTSPTVNQFAAMISLAYNIGLGAFKSSSVRRFHNQGDFASAANAFLLWDKAHVNGVLVPVPGLTVRRKQEAAMYLTGRPTRGVVSA